MLKNFAAMYPGGSCVETIWLDNGIIDNLEISGLPC